MATYTKISTVSKNYAKALMEVAAEDNSFDSFKTQLDNVSDVLNSSEEKKFTVKVAYNEDITSQPGVIDSSLAINLNYVQK